MATSTKNKKAGGRGAKFDQLFDPSAGVQSIIRVRHGTVRGTRQVKSTVFESRWRFFWQNKN